MRARDPKCNRYIIDISADIIVNEESNKRYVKF